MWRSSQNGFTIIELMIATSIFSVMLLLSAGGSIQIGKLFYKGVSSSRAQNAAREIMEDISRTIQFGGAAPTPVAVDTTTSTLPTSYFCINTIRYSYVIDVINGAILGATPPPDGRSPHVLWRDRIPSSANCTEAADLTIPDPDGRGFGEDGQELVPHTMRLKDFTVQQASCGSASCPNFWSIKVGVIFGEGDVIKRAGGVIVGCVESTKGGQFCGLSELQTTVIRRLR